MKINSFDTDKNVFIVAEIGNNHEGSFTLAEEMIGKAAEGGVNAVKFQTFQTELYISRKANRGRFEKIKSFELTFKEFEKLSELANDAGVIFLSTPLDIESAEFLNNIVPAFKISSGDNNFYPLIEKIAGFNKPIMLSSGLSDMSQLQYTKTLIEQVWSNFDKVPGLAVLHCTSSYPVEPKEANLNAIRHIKEELACTVGYSDHTIGVEAAVLAVALGARIVEKHFTIDKNHSDFRDHQLSANPMELSIMVEKIRQSEEYLGNGEKTIQQSEKKNVLSMRRSIVAKHDLRVGTKISMDDITWVRPGGGLSPGNELLVLGKQLRKSKGKSEMIALEDVVPEDTK